jgi:CopG family transcriptional regulator, nickel-responsive regulator
MQRITITIEDELLDEVDAMMQRRGHASRSEALRELIRDSLSHAATAQDETPCVAVLSYVYDHETRALAQRLNRVFHDHHDLSVAALHVHLDHEACLETSVLRGTVGAVHKLADDLTAQRGVRHANLHIVPARIDTTRHDHGSGPLPHQHIHV